MTEEHDVHIWNHVPNPETGLCPSNLFTQPHFEQSKLHNVHIFGCTTYVLDNKSIADRKKIPCWNPRSLLTLNLNENVQRLVSYNMTYIIYVFSLKSWLKS